MKTSGEANQRSLHKFVRAFDTALNALVLPVLEANNGLVGLGDLPSERGAAEVAAAAAFTAATAKEAKAAAAAAKRKVNDDAKALHKAQSMGLSEVGAYEGETIQAGGSLRTSTRPTL
jgi:hypothetical protein